MRKRAKPEIVRFSCPLGALSAATAGAETSVAANMAAAGSVRMDIPDVAPSSRVLARYMHDAAGSARPSRKAFKFGRLSDKLLSQVC